MQGTFGTINDDWAITEETYKSLGFTEMEENIGTIWADCKKSDCKNVETAIKELLENKDHYELSSFAGEVEALIRVMYSLCIFMFVTLVLAAGSIIFLKIGNEVYEDKERYKILEKMGVQKKNLRKSVRNEICFTYYCPFILMMITSYFSVKALGNVMREDLFMVNIWSMGIILLIFTVICAISVYTAKKKLSLIS